MRVARKKDRLSLRTLAAEGVAQLTQEGALQREPEVPGCVLHNVRRSQAEAGKVAVCALFFRGQTCCLTCAAVTAMLRW